MRPNDACLHRENVSILVSIMFCGSSRSRTNENWVNIINTIFDDNRRRGVMIYQLRDNLYFSLDYCQIIIIVSMEEL